MVSSVVLIICQTMIVCFKNKWPAVFESLIIVSVAFLLFWAIMKVMII